MRKIIFEPGEYYHIYNRGTEKRDIFLDNMDRARFLFLILYLQSPLSFLNIGRSVSSFQKKFNFCISRKKILEVKEKRNVKLINFCLMDNHFHLTIFETKGGGTTQYMHRVSTAYTNYFNTKYKRSGHLFQGPFKAVDIKEDQQLLYLSAYIHRNSIEIGKKEKTYLWSSFLDYLGENRWIDLLEPKIILEKFSNKKEYENFVDTSRAKLSEDEKLLLD